MESREVIARRSDLSTFLVHLTRTSNGVSGRDRLASILSSDRISAVTMFGMAKAQLPPGVQLDSQKCVCFTETPLEYVHLLLQAIDGRQIDFEPYGIAFPKRLGRGMQINPVWYLDMTQGYEWLTHAVDALVTQALANGAQLDAHPIARLAPFIEQMFTHRDENQNVIRRKEFWWEREWRKVGPLVLPQRVIVLCPESEFEQFAAVVDGNALLSACFIDPRWGLEQIISRLAGYRPEHSDIL